MLLHPKATKAIAAARLKNDKVDAQRLALLLRGDLLPTVWIRRPPCARRGNSFDTASVSSGPRTQVKNRILAMLARRNFQPTRAKRWMTVRGQQELQALLLSPIPATIREDCLALLRVLDAQIRRLDVDLRSRWGDDPRVQPLPTIPGIGPFIAIVLVLELGDIQRFPTAKHLASYIGLTPRVRASAERVRTGRISKEGNRLLRWVLVAAATQAARRPGPLRAWFRAAQHRKGKKIARVALARRLAEIVYHVWKEESRLPSACVVVSRGGELGLPPGLRTDLLIGQPPSRFRGRSGTAIMGDAARRDVWHTTTSLTRPPYMRRRDRSSTWYSWLSERGCGVGRLETIRRQLTLDQRPIGRPNAVHYILGTADGIRHSRVKRPGKTSGHLLGVYTEKVKERFRWS